MSSLKWQVCLLLYCCLSMYDLHRESSVFNRIRYYVTIQAAQGLSLGGLLLFGRLQCVGTGTIGGMLRAGDYLQLPKCGIAESLFKKYLVAYD